MKEAKSKESLNILVMNGKGGSAKSTNAQLIANCLVDSTLIEIDKVNKSAESIQSDRYKSLQLDFNSNDDVGFLTLENKLLDKGIKVIDVGATKLDIFHRVMGEADTYSMIDLIVIPSMDGREDYQVAYRFLDSLNGYFNLKNILFSFNRFNVHDYGSVEEQFDSFFNNRDVLREKFGIDLELNYYVIFDSKIIKKAKSRGISLQSLIDVDLKELTAKQRSEQDSDKRMVLTKERNIIYNAQNLYRDCISLVEKKVQEKAIEVKKRAE